MALNPQFPNYANGPAGTEVIGWTVVGGHPLYRLPNASVNLSFGFGLVALGSTLEAPTYPQGVYAPNPNIEDAGSISGDPAEGQTLTFTPGGVIGDPTPTVEYQWIRYNPGGTSLLVGTGLNYTTQPGDISHSLFVKTIATNSVGTATTQTVPFGPITPNKPVITDAGTIASLPPNPVPPGGGSIGGLTLTNGGSNYVGAVGVPTVSFNGDGTGAEATATLGETGSVARLITRSASAAPDSTGTYTISGEGSETDIVVTWVTGSGGDAPQVTATLTDPGSGWSQANVDAALIGAYGSVVVTGPPTSRSPIRELFIGVPVVGLTLVNGGSGYTTVSVTITPAESTPSFGSGATATASITSEAPVVFPTQTAVYSGPTVSGDSPQVSWVWGFGSGVDFSPIQLGGLTYSPVPVDAVGKELFVKVYATNLGGTEEAYSTGIEVDGAAPEPVRYPRIGPQDPYVDETLTGEQGLWRGYPAPQVTDWGFAHFAVPTPTPIAGANKVYTYKCTEADQGQQIVFYVTAENSSGSFTAYSNPTDAVFDTLKVSTPAKLSGASVPAEIGDVLTGVPAVYDPLSAYQYSYFAYQDPDTGALTEIAGTRDTTSYTVPETDSGKQIVYYSFGSIVGKFGTESLGSASQSTGRIWEFLQPLGRGTVTFTGDAPLIGATATATVGDVVPAIGSQAGGPTVTRITAYYVEENPATGDVQYWFIATEENPAGPLSFVIPEKADGFGLAMDYEVEYRDAGGAGPVQLKTAPHTLPTPPVEGVIPFVVVEPGFDPNNIYNAGQTLTYVRGEYSGVPTPTDTWVWYMAVDAYGTDRIMVQNGGLTYTLSDTSEGKWVSTVTTIKNAAGTIYSTPASQQVAGPLPVWTRDAILTGNPLMTPTQGTTLSAIYALARDPITDTPIPVTQNWMVQYPGQDPVSLGHPFPTFNFLNENGRWTGGEIFLRSRAENAIGVVYKDSNRIKLQGTPRILSEGSLFTSGFALQWRLNYNPGTADGGTQDVTSTWYVSANINGSICAFSNPATESGCTLTPNGSGTANADQTFSNQQGDTTLSYQRSIQKF
jgi:hypothetical protein